MEFIILIILLLIVYKFIIKSAKTEEFESLKNAQAKRFIKKHKNNKNAVYNPSELSCWSEWDFEKHIRPQL